jgi:hypothetical protein
MKGNCLKMNGCRIKRERPESLKAFNKRLYQRPSRDYLGFRF